MSILLSEKAIKKTNIQFGDRILATKFSTNAYTTLMHNNLTANTTIKSDLDALIKARNDNSQFIKSLEFDDIVVESINNTDVIGCSCITFFIFKIQAVTSDFFIII